MKIALGDHRVSDASVDLRQRVVGFVRSGGSKVEAARRFKVDEASVYRGLKPDGVAYKHPDPRGSPKVDWEQLRCHVEAPPDRIHAERARHFQVSRPCIWNALHTLAVTRYIQDPNATGDERPGLGCPSSEFSAADY